jgi:hypothetical protein
MTQVLITVDTELSALLQQRGASVRANYESSILGRCPAGDFGIGWQMDQLEDHGLKGVYFVDPLPALVLGERFITDIVARIVARGHEVQLHIHTEWLEWATQSPVGGRTGRNIASFSYDDQVTLLTLARDMLMRAGARQPMAFRAGNYGADDVTLAALNHLGMAWDTSFNADYLGNPCGISLPAGQIAPMRHNGMAVAPVSGLFDQPGHFRPAQVCALSSNEMTAALSHAAEQDHPLFTIVTHSFEMLSRDRMRPNRMVMDRFTALCRTIAAHPGLSTTGFATLDPAIADAQPAPLTRLQSTPLRTYKRIAEQVIATWIYERKLKPA